VSCQRGAPRVVPVLIIGSQLLGRTGLHNIDPFGKLDLAGPERYGYI